MKTRLFMALAIAASALTASAAQPKVIAHSLIRLPWILGHSRICPELAPRPC